MTKKLRFTPMDDAIARQTLLSSFSLDDMTSALKLIANDEGIDMAASGAVSLKKTPNITRALETMESVASRVDEAELHFSHFHFFESALHTRRSRRSRSAPAWTGQRITARFPWHLKPTASESPGIVHDFMAGENAIQQIPVTMWHLNTRSRSLADLGPDIHHSWSSYSLLEANKIGGIWCSEWSRVKETIRIKLKTNEVEVPLALVQSCQVPTTKLDMSELRKGMLRTEEEITFTAHLSRYEERAGHASIVLAEKVTRVEHAELDIVIPHLPVFTEESTGIDVHETREEETAGAALNIVQTQRVAVELFLRASESDEARIPAPSPTPRVIVTEATNSFRATSPQGTPEDVIVVDSDSEVDPDELTVLSVHLTTPEKSALAMMTSAMPLPIRTYRRFWKSEPAELVTIDDDEPMGKGVEQSRPSTPVQHEKKIQKTSTEMNDGRKGGKDVKMKRTSIAQSRLHMKVRDDNFWKALFASIESARKLASSPFEQPTSSKISADHRKAVPPINTTSSREIQDSTLSMFRASLESQRMAKTRGLVRPARPQHSRSSSPRSSTSSSQHSSGDHASSSRSSYNSMSGSFSPSAATIEEANILMCFATRSTVCASSPTSALSPESRAKADPHAAIRAAVRRIAAEAAASLRAERQARPAT